MLKAQFNCVCYRKWSLILKVKLYIKACTSGLHVQY